MLRFLGGGRVRLCISAPTVLRGLTTASPRSCPDLRILFCGSDDFSVTSLNALVTAERAGQLPIKSLEVLCRLPKRTGRGLKLVRDVPIVDAAEKLGLRVHKLDTFRNWEQDWDVPAESGFNLIIAVSFGLLIPGRIIKSAKYGGLNVHPSLLPDFAGAAPIEHAILEDCTALGVSVQTLHPTKFDRGQVLRQELVDGVHREDELSTIKQALAEKGASMLVESLQAGEFLEPVRPVEPLTAYPDGSPVLRRKAPKITPEDLHVKWEDWSPEQILTRQKVLGPLWSTLTVRHFCKPGSTETRIKWTGNFRPYQHDLRDVVPRWSREGRTGILQVPLEGGTGLEIERFTIAGKPERTAREAHQLLKITDHDLLKFQ